MSDQIRSSFSLPSSQAIQYLSEADILLAMEPKDLNSMESLSKKIEQTIEILNLIIDEWTKLFSRLDIESLKNEELIFDNFLSNGHRPIDLIYILEDKMFELDLIVHPPKFRATKLCWALNPNIKEEIWDKSFDNENRLKPKIIHKKGQKSPNMDLNNDKMVPNQEKECHSLSCERGENILEANDMSLEINIPNLNAEETILKDVFDVEEKASEQNPLQTDKYIPENEEIIMEKLPNDLGEYIEYTFKLEENIFEIEKKVEKTKPIFIEPEIVWSNELTAKLPFKECPESLLELNETAANGETVPIKSNCFGINKSLTRLSSSLTLKLKKKDKKEVKIPKIKEIKMKVQFEPFKMEKPIDMERWAKEYFMMFSEKNLAEQLSGLQNKYYRPKNLWLLEKIISQNWVIVPFQKRPIVWSSIWFSAVFVLKKLGSFSPIL
jgi:hypothetical protein